jgi:hypothetical protein
MLIIFSKPKLTFTKSNILKYLKIVLTYEGVKLH